MAISQLEFGKNLRPSTVEAINKINELVTAVNDLDGAEIETIKSDISTLKSKADTMNTRITNNANDITSVKQTNETQQTDIDAIKVTLYTPLSSTE